MASALSLPRLLPEVSGFEPFCLPSTQGCPMVLNLQGFVRNVRVRECTGV